MTQDLSSAFVSFWLSSWGSIVGQKPISGPERLVRAVGYFALPRGGTSGSRASVDCPIAFLQVRLLFGQSMPTALVRKRPRTSNAESSARTCATCPFVSDGNAWHIHPTSPSPARMYLIHTHILEPGCRGLYPAVSVLQVQPQLTLETGSVL